MTTFWSVAIAFSILCASFLQGTTNSGGIHDGKDLTDSRAISSEKRPILLVPFSSRDSKPKSEERIKSKVLEHVSVTELTEFKDRNKIAKKKRSVVSAIKIFVKLKRALKILRRDGSPFSRAYLSDEWVKSGGSVRANKDFLSVNPDNVTFEVKNRVKTMRGRYEGAELVLTENLDTKVCTVTLSRSFRDGETWSCTVNYLR